MKRKISPGARQIVILSTIVMSVALCFVFWRIESSSFHSGPSPIVLGEDHCEFCKMSMSNSHYGAEVRTVKGRIYKFDDIQCLIKSLRAGIHVKSDIAEVYLLDYNTLDWIDAEKAWLLHSDSFQSPMSGNIVAFADSLSRNSYFRYTGGELLTWRDVYP